MTTPVLESTSHLPGLSTKVPGQSRTPTLALSVVIVNYRSEAETRRLVQSLSQAEAFDQGRAEIVVIDNGASSGSGLAPIPQARGLTVRRLQENVGFGRAVNLAAQHSRGRWLLLLNPDVEVPVGFLDQVIALSHRVSAQDGVVGLCVRDPAGKVQRSAGTPPTLVDLALGLLRRRERRRCNVTAVSRRHGVAWVSGCGMLIRRACFDQIGGFDPDYFLYYEDVDFSRRARASGWNVVRDPRVWMTHVHPLHTRPVPPRIRLMTRQALLTYSRKHWSTAAATCSAGVVAFESIVRWFLARRDPQARRVFLELWRLAWDCLRGEHRRAYWRAWCMAQDGGRDVRVHE